jgi:hypothetical protein
MFWLLTRVVVWPVKAVAGTAKLGTKATAGSFKVGYRTGRLVGYRRVGLLALGVGVGLLVAPRPGRELRGQLRQRLSERGLLAPPLPPVEPTGFEAASVPDVPPARPAGDGAAAGDSAAASRGAESVAGTAAGPVDAQTAADVAADVAASRPVDPVADEPGSNGPS